MLRLIRQSPEPKPVEAEDPWRQYAVCVAGFSAPIAPGTFSKGMFVPIASEAVRRHPECFRALVGLEEVNTDG